MLLFVRFCVFGASIFDERYARFSDITSFCLLNVAVNVNLGSQTSLWFLPVTSIRRANSRTFDIASSRFRFSSITERFTLTHLSCGPDFRPCVTLTPRSHVVHYRDYSEKCEGVGVDKKKNAKREWVKRRRGSEKSIQFLPRKVAGILSRCATMLVFNTWLKRGERGSERWRDQSDCCEMRPFSLRCVRLTPRSSPSYRASLVGAPLHGLRT